MEILFSQLFGYLFFHFFLNGSCQQLQNPKVWDALNMLRGRELTVAQIQDLYLSVIPGQDFPIFSDIPDDSGINCGDYKQPGYYADTDSGQCQVFHRCDINGNLKSFLCPNMTLFNQITLVCDWWYNVDCSKSKQFYDYSNGRLYQEGVALLDDQDDVGQSTGAVQAKASAISQGQNAGRKKKARSFQ